MASMLRLGALCVHPPRCAASVLLRRRGATYIGLVRPARASFSASSDAWHSNESNESEYTDEEGGDLVPPPLEEVPLPEELLGAARAQQWSVWSPIQRQGMPHVLAGDNVLLCAPSGSGKTAAFSLPLLSRFIGKRAKDKKGRSPWAVIMTPTSQLAVQVAGTLKKLCRHLQRPPTIGVVHPKSGPQEVYDFLVTTPGSAVVRARQGLLQDTEVLVLDECDRLLKHPFLTDIELTHKEICGVDPLDEEDGATSSARPLQMVLSSATIPRPLNPIIRKFAPEYRRINFNPRHRVSPTVEHIAYRVSNRRKRALLAYLLRRKGSLKDKKVLVFTRTRQRSVRLVESLQTQFNISAAALHGELSFAQQQSVVEGFTSGSTQCLVTTEVFSRGVDLESCGLACVINFDMPFTPSEYVHQVGRVGRLSPSTPPPLSPDGSVKKTGKAITFVNAYPQTVSFGSQHVQFNDEHAAGTIEKFIGQRLSYRKVPGPWRDQVELVSRKREHDLYKEEMRAQRGEEKVAESLEVLTKKRQRLPEKDSKGWKGGVPDTADPDDSLLSKLRERGRLRVKRKKEASTARVKVSLRDFREGRAESVFERWDRREGKSKKKRAAGDESVNVFEDAL